MIIYTTQPWLNSHILGILPLQYRSPPSALDKDPTPTCYDRFLRQSKQVPYLNHQTMDT